MVELCLLEATIVACHAAAAALDGWPPASNRVASRVAPDELWVIASRSGRCDLVRSVEQSLRALAPDALVVDQTDGWTAWSLEGARAAHALARLTVMPLDRGTAGFLQGAIAGVPAKVLVTPSGFQVFVPAPVGHHLRDRLLEACADLVPTMGAAKPFEGPAR